MGFRIIIPARYASTRLPGKPLREIAGRPMIQHVYERAHASAASEVVIATDDARIRQAAEAFGARVCMTSPDHTSGTERLAEAVDLCGCADDEIVVNLQGDEPRMPAACLDQVAGELQSRSDARVATLCTAIAEADEVFDPNVVKVVRDANGYALYFSRAPIPWHRERFAESHESIAGREEPYWRHIGLYAYRAGYIKEYAGLAPCDLERTESLEQLRVLWHGGRIAVAEAVRVPPPGVDSEEDLQRAEAAMEVAG
ncbi:MAG: 3-deoxy-manno-octulosonate cytidylyltransferase [Pseudomonadota bacterium]|nr:MAG: 3-deoxy-manno-octulosonate cytidylyltransferase [Pseudomonadota bacterium]